ncbi:M20/M25/M40 family metallo-hydrolase [candidate division KSB1 bacterium]|nr:M20/M25/M40 family metallo-hydrolase [candidate division KSB1 bacterium]
MRWLQIVSVILIGLLFGLLIAFASAAPQMLVRVERDGKSEWPLWTHDALRVVINGDGYVAALCSQADFLRLQKAGMAVRVLDPQPGTRSYYRVDRQIVPRLEASGEYDRIDVDDVSLLIKIDENRAEELIGSGVPLARVFTSGLPLLESEHRLVIEQTVSAPVSLIEQVVEELSDSSFFTLVERLQGFRTRYVYSDSTPAVRNWIETKFREFGYTEVVMDSFQLNGTVQRNVFAVKPGTQQTDRVIVVGGHYDSIVGNRQVAMVDAPGADDNGTGTAGAMEIARALAGVDLETTVIFVAFAAEELGLWGSEFFARNAFHSGMKIDVMLNMDMIANVADDFPDVNILTDKRSRAFADLAFDLTTQHTALIPVIGNSGSASDHYYFQQYGYPALFFQEGDFSPVYHSTSDRTDYIDPVYATDVLKIVSATLVMTSESPGAPADLVNLETGDGVTQIIHWSANSEPDLAGYRIYVGDDGGDYALRYETTVTWDTLRGLDPDKTYHLAVSAFDQDGNESLLSKELIFTPRSAPRIPTGLVSTSSRDHIQLSWEQTNAELDFAGYVLHKNAEGMETQIVELPAEQDSYVDTEVEPHVLYRYTLTARDGDGLQSDFSDQVLGRLATHDRGILLVDGTNDGNDRPLMPSDTTVDLFYAELLKGLNAVDHWDLKQNSQDGILPTDADLGVYSTLIWHSDVVSTQRSLAADTTTLKKYLDNGGKLILSGWGLLSNLTGSSAALKQFKAGHFAYDYLGVASAFSADGSMRDFQGADAQLDGFSDLDVDAVKAEAFKGNLIAMETLENRQTGRVVYTYRSSAEPRSVFHQQPVALARNEENYDLVLLNFPLFFIEQEQARVLLARLLTDFGEQPTSVVDAADRPAPMPREFELGQNYPNPFNPITRIPLALPRSTRVRVAVYDVIGRLTDVVYEGTLPAGRHELSWDAQDIASGVYFYKMEADQFTALRKLILLR